MVISPNKFEKWLYNLKAGYFFINLLFSLWILSVNHLENVILAVWDGKSIRLFSLERCFC